MKQPMSPLRRAYFIRLIARIAILIVAIAFYFTKPEIYGILTGFRFFEGFSILHLLWLTWIIGMIEQLIPVRKVPLGSQKLFLARFKPIRDKVSPQALKRFIVDTTRAALWVLLVWVALIGALGVLHAAGILSDTMLFLITIFFYVCDLICVLIWCPFRLMMRNRCCTTCRIFNWDHLMMFSPLIFVPGVYTWSLLLLSIAVWLLWEICFFLYPERFWDHSNAALQCVNCTDKLCTQYCKKLRK